MAATVYIPVSEYLRTSYRPDCDYVDGEIAERNLGEQWHSEVQTAVAAIFYVNRKAWGFRALTEQRVQVSVTRFRIPDVCALPASQPLQTFSRPRPLSASKSSRRKTVFKR